MMSEEDDMLVLQRGDRRLGFGDGILRGVDGTGCVRIRSWR